MRKAGATRALISPYITSTHHHQGLGHGVGPVREFIVLGPYVYRRQVRNVFRNPDYRVVADFLTDGNNRGTSHTAFGGGT